MQKIIRSIFITKPMAINYISTIILNFVSFLFLMYLIIYEQNKIDLNWYIGFSIFYLVLVVCFIFYYKKDLNINLGTFSEQLKVDFKPSITLYFIKSLLVSILYILTYFILSDLIRVILNGNTTNAMSISISIFIFILAITRISFEISKISPFILLGWFIIPLLVFSFVGIEKALLGWTFLAMLLGIVSNQFLSMDLKQLVPERFKVLIKNEEELKEKITRKKYTLIIFMPIFYLSLLLAEKISESHFYIYMINSIYSKHFQVIPSDDFSVILIWNAALKLFIVFLGWVCIDICNNWILETISMKLLGVSVSLNNISLQKGKYNCVKYKISSRKWEISEDYYIRLVGNVIIEIRLKENIRNQFKISDNLLLSDQGKKKTIKFISNNILKIDDNFFVLDKSDTQSKISNQNKQVGINILQINHYSIWSFLASIIFLFFLLSQMIDFAMKNNYRGVYFYSISGDINKPNFDENDKIVFSEDNIYLIKRNNVRNIPDIITKYRYDNVTMTIKNNKDVKIGEIESIPDYALGKKSIIVYENNIKKTYYLVER